MKNLSIDNDIYSLSKTLADQKDLETLCEDRRLDTEEIFPPNAFYGIDSIIKTYTGLTNNHLLKLIIPHGIVFSKDHVWEAEANFPLPVVLSYPDYRFESYKRRSKKIVIKASSPYLYLLELMKQTPKPKRNGLIFFPSHSTHHVTAETDYEEIVKTLLKLEKIFNPITVCMYWRDYNLGRHRYFTKHGINVVSAGHMYDPNFLYRFYHLCSFHKYSASNDLGSSLFYSIASGCSFFFINNIITMYKADHTVLDQDHPPIPNETEKQLRNLFNFPISYSDEERDSVANLYLGKKHQLSPKDLKLILIHAGNMDKYGYFIDREYGGNEYVFSPNIKRRIRQFKSFIKSTIPTNYQ